MKLTSDLCVLFVGLGLLLPLLAGSAGAQPITFPSSMSIGEGDFVARLQPWYERSTDDPSGRNRELTDWNTRLFGMYGLTERTSLFARSSYVHRSYHDGTTRRTERGFGDLEVFIRDTIYERNWAKGTFSVSPYVGVELPTGEDTATGFPGGLTPGSGSLDGVAGIAVRDATLGEPHRFFNVEYQLNREHGSFERGNVLRVNAAWKPPLATWEKQNDVAGLNGMMETNVRWQERHELDGSGVPDSGGTQLFGTIGAVYTTHRTIVEAALQVPVVQNLNGDSLENDFKVLVGVWKNF